MQAIKYMGLCLGTDVFVTYDTGDPDGTVYHEFMGHGQLSISMSHNYSTTGYFKISVNISNLVR